MPLVTFLAWVVQPSAPSFQAGNLAVITNLEEYTRAHPEMENAAEAFEAAGMTAKREPNGDMSLYYFSARDWFCNDDIPNHVEQIRQWATLTSGYEMDTETATRLRSGNFTPRACLRPVRLGEHPTAKEVLQVTYTSVALWQLRVENTFRALVISLGIALVLLNAYYRGFVYILCGARNSVVQPEL